MSPVRYLGDTAARVDSWLTSCSVEVVDALVGCVRWSLDLLAWLTDSLFGLMIDDDFMEKLNAQRFSEVAPYLQSKGDVSLHLLFCSSSRSFLMALCRRIVHLEMTSARAVDFYRKNSATAESGGVSRANPRLQQAYQRMLQVISSSLLKANEFEQLLNVLGSDIRQTYQQYLPNIVKQQPNAPQGKQIDIAIKSMKNQLELSMLLGQAPPPALAQVIKKFLGKEVAAFREKTDPAALFFADFSLLEVQDDKHSLEERMSKGLYVDVFKRKEIHMTPSQQWRRCARCTAVMEDVFGTRPGFTFVVNTQRKCSCNGHWGLLPKGKLSI
jgi:mediator of RNA polymerase II transcription subunit 16